MKFDVRMAHRWVFTSPLLSKTPTHFHLWGGKENFSVQVSCWICIISMMSLWHITFFPLIYGLSFVCWSAMILYILLQLKIFYLTFATYLTGLLSANTYGLLVTLFAQHSSFRMQYSSPRCFFELGLQLCSLFASLFYLHRYSRNRN